MHQQCRGSMIQLLTKSTQTYANCPRHNYSPRSQNDHVRRQSNDATASQDYIAYVTEDIPPFSQVPKSGKPSRLSKSDTTAPRTHHTFYNLTMSRWQQVSASRAIHTFTRDSLIATKAKEALTRAIALTSKKGIYP